MDKQLAQIFKLATAALAALTIFGSGCTCQKQSTGGDKTTPQNNAGQQPETTVNLAIWSNYISDAMLQKFTASTGIKVQVSNYSSNEELLAKLQAGGSGIDVAVPSDYMVSIMRNLNILRELDRSRLSNFDGLSPVFLNKSYDPGNRFSVPYGWTITGIAWNTDLVKTPVNSWAELLERPDIAGKISLLDDAREALGAALRAKGKSINTVDADSLKIGRDFLASAKPRIKAFTSEPFDQIVAGDIAVAQIYSSDALQAGKKTAGKVKFQIPDEGGTLAIDNVVVPASTKNPDAAMILVNFLISAEANLDYVTSVMGGPVVARTVDLLPPELKNDPGLFPAAEKLATCEMIQDIGAATEVWDRAWTEIKVNH